jgi:hypothetical protein
MSKHSNKVTKTRRTRRILNRSDEATNVTGRRLAIIRYGDGISRQQVETRDQR